MTPDLRDASCILLSDGSLGSALQAARLLGQRGVSVYVACAGAGAGPMSRSRWVVEAVDLPAGDSGAYTAALKAWTDHWGRTPPGPVPIVPLSDRLAAWLDEVRADLDKKFICAIPQSDALKILLDKSLSLEAAEGAGLDVLPWRQVLTSADVPAAVDLPLPVIIRPTSYDVRGDTYFKQAVFHGQAELRSFLEERVRQGARMVAQQYLEVGPQAVEFAIVATGGSQEILSLVTGRKLVQSQPGGGVMAWGEAVDLPDVAKVCKSFVDATSFEGAGGLEVIRHLGKLWFVEFNPRAEAIHSLADLAGAPNIISVVSALITRVDQEPPKPEYPAALWVETAWLERVRRNRSTLPSMLTAYRAHRRYVRRSGLIFSWNDPRPGLAYAARLILGAMRALRRSEGAA